MPTAAATELGVADFKDLAAHADEFDEKIYGIETGAPANQNLQKMIDADDFGLGDWTLVESGEQAMLAQVTRAEKADDAIVFLAWAPHPMNTAFELTYLSGGDAYFGPDFGGAQVYTLARTGWAADCPNAAQFFKDLVFTVDMENQMMGLILDEGEAPDEAAEAWLKDQPGRARPLARRASPRSTASPACRRSSRRSASDGGNEAAEHPGPDGRPARRDVLPRRPGRLPARAAPARARRALGPLRQRLHRQPALRPGAGRLHVRPAAQPHRRLRQRRRVRLRHPDLRPPPAPRRLPDLPCRARCTSSAPTSCTASRSG